MKTNHSESRMKAAVMTVSDLTPARLNLVIGDTVYVYKPAGKDDCEIGREKCVPVKILKL